MIILLSPAKTLDFESPSVLSEETKPQFHTDANRLAAKLQGYSAAQLSKLMNISPALGEKVQAYFAAWKRKYDARGTKHAIFAYQGDVYVGLKADQFSRGDLEFAQRHLRILSGLYGLVRPFDLIQPYRLEMGTKLAVDRSNDLYTYWGKRITDAVRKALDDCDERVVVNLASSEYSRVVDMSKLNARVITPSFKEEKGGKYRFLTVFGKQARGVMARYLIQSRIERADDVATFQDDGYRLNKSLSTPDEPVFTRKQPVAVTKQPSRSV
jgi:cytoplasmic iron level regulating protein YaaA (DUF328/UPF0246 family)